MISPALKADNRVIRSNKEFLEGIAKIPSWEIIKEFYINKTQFIFFNKRLKAALLKKFSEKLMIDKYLIRESEGKTLANMDLRIYKDSVYIISFNMNTSGIYTPEAAAALLDTAIERADGTSKKEVFIAVPNEEKHKHEIKRLLIKKGFKLEEGGCGCEQKLFGETFKYTAENI